MKKYVVLSFLGTVSLLSLSVFFADRPIKADSTDNYACVIRWERYNGTESKTCIQVRNENSCDCNENGCWATGTNERFTVLRVHNLYITAHATPYGVCSKMKF